MSLKLLSKFSVHGSEYVWFDLDGERWEGGGQWALVGSGHQWEAWPCVWSGPEFWCSEVFTCFCWNLPDTMAALDPCFRFIEKL